MTGKTEPQVKLPGSTQYLPLSEAKTLPPGTSVNVSGNAAIQLSDPANKQMIFFGVPDKVPSLFTLAGQANGVVRLTLIGGNFTSCGTRRLSARSGLSVESAQLKKPTKPAAPVKPVKPVRRLWGTGKGKFTTTGKFASATVRGTEWLVADFCTGTRVTVRRGIVSVRDLAKKKTVLVKAGHSYFAASKK